MPATVHHAAYAAYTGIAAALHMGPAYDPAETAKTGACATVESWADTADAAVDAAFQIRPPGHPQPQSWNICYALPLHCSHRQPGGFHAARCPDDAAYVQIRRDAPEQTAGWCDTHAADRVAPDSPAYFALYPARQGDWALRQHILLTELESLAIPAPDDDFDRIAIGAAAARLAGEIRGRLAAVDIRQAGGAAGVPAAPSPAPTPRPPDDDDADTLAWRKGYRAGWNAAHAGMPYPGPTGQSGFDAGRYAGLHRNALGLPAGAPTPA